ncbi:MULTISPECIES: biotin--[acetyl-CoA-carboxylase] ligase [unclassified Serinicoccus]|uniref:biotin--[acetyl-CoA-carboxylase] ligase n=1 Tax=unclassified Serinicoccus TaxID=2643101 RepID=UPI003851E7A6
MQTLRWDAPEWHESLGSTNDVALADARPGRVVVADHQSAGRGRRGRTWSSPPFTCLAISAVLPAPAPATSGWVPLAAGLAVVAALGRSRWPVRAVLKWPNDVLLETGPRPGKICGVLAQVAPGGAVVVGAGINVDHDADQLPVPSATSWRLARGGAPLPDGARASLLEDYLARLAELSDALGAGDVAAVRTAYLDRCSTLGRQVVVHRPDGGLTEGRASGVDASGALVVDGEGTSVHHAGDVVHVRPQ